MGRLLRLAPERFHFLLEHTVVHIGAPQLLLGRIEFLFELLLRLLSLQHQAFVCFVDGCQLLRNGYQLLLAIVELALQQQMLVCSIPAQTLLFALLLLFACLQQLLFAPLLEVQFDLQGDSIFS